MKLSTQMLIFLFLTSLPGAFVCGDEENDNGTAGTDADLRGNNGGGNGAGNNDVDGNNGTAGNDTNSLNNGGGKNKAPTCSITKGGTLVSFLNARAQVELPCRYVVGEFFCHSKTRVMAQNSQAKDKHTYVSSVTVRKSLDPLDTSAGGVVDNYEEITLSMNTLREIFRAWDDNETYPNETQWDRLCDDMYVSKDRKWTVVVDNVTQEAMLTDNEEKALQVNLTLVNPGSDMKHAGGLTVFCSHPSFGPVAGSPGYLCGNVGEGGDDQHHLREEADAVGLSVTDYVTYNILVEQDVLQTNPVCQRSGDSTSTCAYPVEAVDRCAQFLHQSTYVYKCFQRRSVSPLEAFVACVRLRCRKDWPSCQALADVLGECPKYLKYKRELPCEKVKVESEE